MSGGKKKVTVGHKLSLGVLAKFCHGPIDRITQFFFDDKVAASGSWDGTPNDDLFPEYAGPAHGQTVEIYKPNLHGSDYGGVQGRAIIRMGRDDQPVNEMFTTSEFVGQDEISADRGVVSVLYTGFGGMPSNPFLILFVSSFWYQFYWGNRPQLPRFGIRAQRVHVQDNGLPQWYDEKAAIGKVSGSHISLYFALDFSGSMNEMTDNGKTRYQNMRDAIFGVLDSLLLTTSSSQGLFSADVMIVGFGTAPSTRTSIQRRNINQTSINQIKSWFPSAPSGYYGYFTAGVMDAGSFFAGSPADSTRKVLFITDGDPTSPGYTSIQIANEAKAALFSIPNVQSHGFNIDLEDTTYTRMMDNMSQGNIPVIRGSNSSALRQVIIYSIFGYLDMNPVHAIRERMISSICGMNIPESMLDDDQLKECADIIWNEQLGVSFSWDRSKPVSELIDDICAHIDALPPQMDRRTGKIYLPLIRDNYDRENVFVIDKTNIVKIEDYERPSRSDLINTIIVKYKDLEAKKEMSITRTDPALYKEQGGTRSQVHSMYFFSNYQSANKAAIRLLRAATKRLRRCTVYANRSAASLRPGDVVRMFYDEPYFEGVIMRVLGVRYGTGMNQEVTLFLSEDIYDFDASAVFTEDEQVEIPNLTGDLEPLTYQKAFEIPYYELAQNLGDAEAFQLTSLYPEVGYIGAVAGNPASFIDAKIHVDSGSGYEEIGAVEYCPVAVLSEELGLVNEDGTIVEHAIVDELGDVGAARIGSYFIVNDECIRYDGIDIDGSIMIGRGCLDTVPQVHPIGSALYFGDDLLELIDEQYVASETINVKLLPNTGSEILDINDAVAMPVNMNSRAARPYLPGNVKINGEYFPASIDPGDVVVTWNHRDRTQQTTGSIVDFTDGDIGPEDPVEYEVKNYDDETDIELFDSGLITGKVAIIPSANIARDNRIEIKSYRDDLESYFKYVIRCTLPIDIDTSTVHGAANLETYNADLSLYPGGILNPPFKWAIAGGKLPKGLHLGSSSTDTCQITGVPNDTVGYYDVLVQVEDANGIVVRRVVEIGLGDIAMLSHFNGTAGSSTFSDVVEGSWSKSGSPTVVEDVDALGGSQLRCLSSQSSYLYMSAPAWVALPLNKCTVIEFFYTPLSTGIQETALSTRSGGSVGFDVRVDSAQAFFFVQAGVDISWNPVLFIPVGGRTHVAIILDGYDMLIYINGLLYQTGTRTLAPITGGRLQVGRTQASGFTRQINGFVDELRVTVGSVGSSRYRTPFNPPSTESDYPAAQLPISVTGSLPAATANTAYSSTVDLIIAGTATPFTVSVISGALPSGWTATVNGNFVEVEGAGVPAGSYYFTLQVTDSNSETASIPLYLEITP